VNVTDEGIKLIARWEGLHKVTRDGLVYPYLDKISRKKGLWTVGYGLTRINGKRVTRDTGPFTKEECLDMLKDEVLHLYAPATSRALQVELPDSAYSALVSFTYNLGAGNLRASTLLKKVNAGKFNEVPGQFLRWNKSGGRVYKGLTLRRLDEAAMFMQDI